VVEIGHNVKGLDSNELDVLVRQDVVVDGEIILDEALKDTAT